MVEPPRSIDSPGMVPSLEELSNAWAAKFGDAWVEETALNDWFWQDATERLVKRGYLEDLEVAKKASLSLVRVYRLCK